MPIRLEDVMSEREAARAADNSNRKIREMVSASIRNEMTGGRRIAHNAYRQMSAVS
jgi:hypothetical protein